MRKTLQTLIVFAAAAIHGATAQTAAPSVSSAYVLGSGDQLTVFVADLPDEFDSKIFRIDTSGDVSLPVIGHLHAAGLTTNELEQSAKASLTHVLKDPQVSISLAGFGSQSVAVLGAVNYPGMRQLEGHKNLFELLSIAGGLRPDAGYLVKITRSLVNGPLPLPDAVSDTVTQTSVASVRLKDLINATNQQVNIAILPGDTISVPKADVVYAVGCVNKPGGFALNEHESLSALQVVSLAEGLMKTAATEKAKILRAIPGSSERSEIPVNLKLLMAGKGADVPLLPDDILFIPNSSAKSVAFRSVDAIVGLASGVAIYGRL